MTRLKPLLPSLLLAVSLAGCGASSVSTLDSAGVGAAQLAVSDGAAPRNGPEAQSVRKLADKFGANAKAGTPAYRIGPLDVLEVSVFKVPELSKIAQVSETGTISVPLIGDVKAAGLTGREVEADLAKRWGDKYLRNPQVSVFVKEMNSQRVTVEGAVKKPGVYPMQPNMTLLQALAHANGEERTADNVVIIFREVAGQRQAARFDLTEIRLSGNDPLVAPGDVVVVNSSATKEAFENFIKLAPALRLFVGL
jgi:polysaccharide export outer membrane protein